MKTRHISIIVLLVLALAGCSSPSNQPTPSPKPVTPSPKPVTYEYMYEIVDTRAACEPDIETWSELLWLSSGYSDKEQADSAAQKAAAIVLCTESILQERLSQRGAENWKLVAFEALTPSQYDLGIEYTYRLVWERPKE